MNPSIKCFFKNFLLFTAVLIHLDPLFAQHDEPTTHLEEPPLFYWDAKPQLGFVNFGDALSEALVERMLGRHIQIASQPFNGQKKLLGMGSIMSYAQDYDVIWGTGVNGKSPEKRGHSK